MRAHLNPYIIYLSISAILTLVASRTAWRRTAPGSFTLSMLMLAMSVWSGGYALHWVLLPEPMKMLLPSFIYLGVLAVPSLFLIYALQFSDHDIWLTRRSFSILAVEPLVTMLLLWTNRYHHLMFPSVINITDGNFTWTQFVHGPWYHVNLAYSFTLILTGFFVLVIAASRASPLLRHQYRMVILASIIPWMTSVYSEFISLGNKLDLTPFSFGLAGVIFSYTVLRNRFMDLIPVARSRLIESMSDGILVLDLNNRIVDINPAMQNFLQIERASYLGRSASEALTAWLENADPLLNGEETRTELRIPNAPSRYLDLRMTPLYDSYQRLNGRLMVFRDITDRKQVEKKLRYANDRLQSQLIEIGMLQSKLRAQAIRDPLTNLFNRRYLDETLDRELARSAREDYPVCVIMMDIDHFKLVNDTYGHEAGDYILKALAGTLSLQNRRGDFTCRYGGEEFVVVMPNIAVETAYERAEKLRISLNALKVPYGRYSLTTTISMGVACYPTNAEDRDGILRAADRALYSAKKSGRNKVFIYDQVERHQQHGN